MRKVSCIVCAHNEAQRIRGVLSALEKHSLIDEVIVVDDGSTDGTADIVRSLPWITLVSNPVNRGKSYALALGIEQAKNETLLFLDADLVGLTGGDVTKLLDPVLRGAVDVAISLRKFVYNFFPPLIGIDYVSGDRVLPKSLFAHSLEELRGVPGFGAEVYINKLILNNNLRVEVVRWEEVLNPPKSEKMGLWSGLTKELGMYSDILKVIPPQEIVRQNLLMRLRAGAR